ncbi:TrmH family RNA methyltransferase [Canibacter zhoujuaniae]|uniref:TrmH family RNA methyltransferase n=1 Tax=Canibacter zhoujuaniae TaxID=2708343 RepID=UPI00141EDD23|nr:RNA methyltransferase [Canibacter zhoujuaniae]
MTILTWEDAPQAVLADFVHLTEVQLRSKSEVAHGVFVAESEKIINRALQAGLTPRAALLQEKHLDTLTPLIKQYPKVPIVLGTSEQLAAVTGYNVHRGALATFNRPRPAEITPLLQNAKTVVVLDQLVDHANVGAIFRAAAGLGADAVLLTEGCADPLYRRAIKVSMGSVFNVAWAHLPRWEEAGPLLRKMGFTLAGLALRENAVDLLEFASNPPEKVAFLLGSEGPGLSRKALGASDVLVKIPMQNGVDSLNVAHAASLSLWSLRAVSQLNQS